MLLWRFSGYSDAMKPSRIRLSQLSLRDLGIVALPLLALVVAAFWVAYRFVKPAPPDSFVVATGRADGAYHAVGTRYAERLARHGIKVVLRPTAGSVENLQHLADSRSDVEVGFVQAGTGDADDYPGLVSLGGIYYESVWIFYRGATLHDRLRGLRGKRIAVGAAGSGTRRLATQLLLVNEAWSPPTKIVDSDGDAAATALLRGELDAVFLVGPPDNPSIRRLLLAPGVKLMSFARTAAYSKVFPFLAPVTLPQGAIDLALIDLLMEAMAQIHGGADVLHKAGDFPSSRSPGFPLSGEAQRFYKSGPPLLQRYMPYWAATFLERIVVMLVPLIAVLLPVMRFAPDLYRWRIRSRIYRWYGELKLLELELKEKFDASRVAEYRKRLDSLDERANMRPMPLAFFDQVYTLRQHVDLVRGTLDRMARATERS